MAAKRGFSSPPPAQSSTSDGEASSSDEEQEVAELAPSQTKNPKRTERDDDESDSDSGSESEPEPEPEPPAVARNTAQKPSQHDGSSDEEEDEEEEEEKEEEKREPPPVKKPESKPDKKKLKPSDPSPSKKSQSGIINRIWAPEDEVVLLRALSEYQEKHGKLPPQKDHESFLSGISGLIRFPVTEKQLFNKVRHIRHTHQKKKKSGIKFSDPHKKAVFDMCEKLFEGNSKVPKKEVAEESDDDVGMKNRSAANAGAANSGAINGGVKVRSELSYPYLRGMIDELVSRQQSLSVLGKIGDVVGLIGESKAQYFEEKTKELKIDAMKLGVKELKLTMKLFDTLTDELAKASE